MRKQISHLSTLAQYHQNHKLVQSLWSLFWNLQEASPLYLLRQEVFSNQQLRANLPLPLTVSLISRKNVQRGKSQTAVLLLELLRRYQIFKIRLPQGPLDSIRELDH